MTDNGIISERWDKKITIHLPQDVFLALDEHGESIARAFPDCFPDKAAPMITLLLCAWYEEQKFRRYSNLMDMWEDISPGTIPDIDPKYAARIQECLSAARRAGE